MKNTIQRIGLAALIATVATLAQAQTSTSGQSRSGTQTSPYVGECVPDVSGSGQSSTGQKAGKGKGSSGSSGTTSDTCPPGMTRSTTPSSGQGGVSPGASSPEMGSGSEGTGSRSGTSTNRDGSTRDNSRSPQGGSTGGSSGSKSGTNR